MRCKAKILGWKVQSYTNEYPALGSVKDSPAVEFGNSPVRDKAARLEYIAELCEKEIDFSVTPIWRS